MQLTTVRVPASDRDLWYAAAKMLGVSQSEFLRHSLRERAARVLAAPAARVVQAR